MLIKKPIDDLQRPEVKITFNDAFMNDCKVLSASFIKKNANLNEKPTTRNGN
jgi:hypothetical protein